LEIDLKKPSMFTEDNDLDMVLMSKIEFSDFYKNNGRKYMWDNYFTDLSETKTAKGERLYKGMR